MTKLHGLDFSWVREVTEKNIKSFKIFRTYAFHNKNFDDCEKYTKIINKLEDYLYEFEEVVEKGNLEFKRINKPKTLEEIKNELINAKNNYLDLQAKIKEIEKT